MLGANQVLMDAFYTDVRADLASWREARGLPADPMRAFAESGYQARINEERAGGQQAGWGAWLCPGLLSRAVAGVVGFGANLRSCRRQFFDRSAG